jgi:hypothetical protein
VVVDVEPIENAVPVSFITPVAVTVPADTPLIYTVQTFPFLTQAICVQTFGDIELTVAILKAQDEPLNDA